VRRRPSRRAGSRAGGLLPEVADPRQLVAEGEALAIGARVDPLLREDADHPARGEHRRGEARTLLVRPVDHIERSPRHHPRPVQGRGDFERGHDAEDAVEAPAARHRVEVRADEDRREVRVAPGPPPVDIAEVVYARLQPLFAQPRHEEVARRAVGIGQREAAHPPGGRPAEFGRRQRGEAALHPGEVDRHGDSGGEE
jgi:hypothetical protein